MEMHSRDVGGVAVVDLVGRMTSSDGAGVLAARVARLMAEGHTQVVLNLAQLSYMDSSGLGEMVSCYSKVCKAGGTIRLAETTARIQDLLAITRLVTVFESYDTEALAVASFGMSPAEA
jgi:anti-sigma B factor antagonist